MMAPETKDKVSARLKRVAGQVAGIERMVEEDRYCVDVLLQISAARAALAKVSRMMLESHIETCVTRAVASRDPAERARKLSELSEVLDKVYGG